MSVYTIRSSTFIIPCMSCGWHASIIIDGEFRGQTVSKEDARKSVTRLESSENLNLSSLREMIGQMSEIPDENRQVSVIKKKIVEEHRNQRGCLDHHFVRIMETTDERIEEFCFE